MAIALFFIGHWTLSVFCQSFFLHRYASHRMFTMSKGWERFFYVLTYITQGSSFLTPRGYAIMHRMHHAFSDTPKDPHSPRNYPSGPRGFFAMMRSMWVTYHDLAHERVEPDPRFTGGYPEMRALDKIGRSYPFCIAWGALYALFYIKFATSPWQLALVPLHWLMGPIHGAIVNWCGHRYGYRNFNSDDDAKNTLVFDVVTLGELFQNNHHRYGQSPNFAVRWFEIDPTYQVMRVFAWLGIIDFGTKRQIARYPETQPQPSVELISSAQPE
jgi:stearoyl-CoA desaturase (delta-9 desaturase)